MQEGCAQVARSPPAFPEDADAIEVASRRVILVVEGL